MAGPQYLHDYVALWRSMRGADASFRAEYQKAALVGIGLADFELETGAGRRATMKTKTKSLDAIRQSQALVDRVWLLTKTGGGRAAAITVGRTADNDVVIPEYSMSKHHCEFRYEPGRIVVVDRGSLNGTWYLERRLDTTKGQAVKDRDRLRLGRYQFEFFSAAGFVERIEKLAETTRP